jgi:hypothetical protein
VRAVTGTDLIGGDVAAVTARPASSAAIRSRNRIVSTTIRRDAVPGARFQVCLRLTA